MTGERRKQKQIRWLVGGENGRESIGHLGETVLVPKRLAAVERWSQDDLEVKQVFIPVPNDA